MPNHFKLAAYEIVDAGGDDIVVLVSGHKKYYSILRNAFHQYHFSKLFSDRKKGYTWGTYIYKVSQDARKQIITLLDLFKKVVCIDDVLLQTFALNYHSESTPEGVDKTAMGKLVYSAKPYKNPTSAKQLENAQKLAQYYVKFLSLHPSYLRSNYLVAVPPKPNKNFDLPSFILEYVCKQLNIKNGQGFLLRSGHSGPMKDFRTVKEKSDNIRGEFRVVNNAPFSGQVITIFDDIYQSGATLHELASTLQNSGAIVQGLVATKTLGNPR